MDQKKQTFVILIFRKQALAISLAEIGIDTE